MKRSLNEVTNEYRKALNGAGYPVGIAQDGALAAACLQLAGYDSASAILAALPDGEEGELSACLPQIPALFECVLAGEEEVSLHGLDAPMLALGSGLHLSRQHQTAFIVILDNNEFTIAPWGISPKPDEAELTRNAPNLTIRAIAALDASKEPLMAEGEGVEINEALWPDIQRWSKETYVPATEQSRLAGAGAGLTDND